MRRSCSLSALAALLAIAIAPSAGAAEVEVVLDGLSGPLETAVRSRLELARYGKRDVSAAQLRRLQRRAPEQIRAALEPYGYYHATVTPSLDEVAGGYRVRFVVVPGPPTVVDEIDIEVDGEARLLRPVARALRRFAPKPGATLDHGLYERSKADLQVALMASGYLDAEPTTHRIEVRRAAQRADIALAWTLGPRYRHGTTRFAGSQLDPDLLQRYVPWQPGDYYDQTQMLLLQQRLTDADYFAVVDVAPASGDAVDGVVPIDVTVAPAKRTVYAAGVFVGTDTGPGVRGEIRRRWVNTRGHKLTLGAELSQRLNLANVIYRIPLPGPNDRSYNLGAAWRDERTETSESTTLRLTANETRLWQGWTRTLGMQFLSGTFTVAEQDGESTLLYPEATLSRKQGDNVDFTRRGWSLALAARAGAEGALSDTSFVQAQAEAKWIRSIGRRTRFIARGLLGATWVEDFDALPPELRYFAGGDRTIRGYAFETIGPRNAADLVVGGRHIVAASAELEHYFVRSWGAAVFVDAGDAFSGTAFDTRVGAGVGLRWRSPVGLLRVDLGIPVGDPRESGVQLHLVVGPDL